MLRLKVRSQALTIVWVPQAPAEALQESLASAGATFRVARDLVEAGQEEAPAVGVYGDTKLTLYECQEGERPC